VGGWLVILGVGSREANQVGGWLSILGVGSREANQVGGWLAIPAVVSRAGGGQASPAAYSPSRSISHRSVRSSWSAASKYSRVRCTRTSSEVYQLMVWIRGGLRPPTDRS